ncbi:MULTISPECIES: hypothetical protein [unclassified Roseateles]|uniref:hypothetical protein n=1 Tax=unclassified Roseateles TaxID=2626991 RepID=UPI0006F2C4DD|nr:MULTISPECIES: hypothetical protein [unclassified Roseateles]KQW45592.1 hypothetical protein ASC81_11880 [Pelomonas sp. Root405]KRA72436.1 hypothetical protein ASD88_11880 [Pelomonas sp. Root662]
MNLLTPRLIAAALLAVTTAQADDTAANADKRALNLAVQRDGRHNQSAAAAVSLPVGRAAWVQVGAGQSRSRDAVSGERYKPGQLSVGGGVAGKAWQASLNASQRRDGERLRQTDWAAAADWRPMDGVSIGVDALRRQARARGTLASSAGATTPIEQRVRGHGVGLRAAVAVTPRVSVYGAAMRNRYRTTTPQATGNAGGGGGLLAGVPLLGQRVTAINRDEAAFDRSAQLGATWRASERVALNGELMQDRLHHGGNLRSVQMKAAIAAGAGWTLTPGIGRSRGPNGEGANYGLLGASYAW